MRLFGAHLSTSGGLQKAVKKIVAMGGNVLQIFSSSPRSWAMPPFIGQPMPAVQAIFIHAKYLINLASDKEELVRKSIFSLKYDLKVGNQIGAKGVIVHLGSHQGRGFEAVKQQLIDSINIILQDNHGGCRLLIENSAGQQGKLCSQLSEIMLLLSYVYSRQLGWCLDTCHAFNAGYTIGLVSGNSLIRNDIVLEAKKLGILDKLVCVHINDSRDEFNSGHDRHANLGEGKLGQQLANYVNHPELVHLPFILETPGFDGLGPDKKNLEILKSLAA